MKSLLSKVYGAVIRLRNRAYDSSLIRVHDIAAPVFSVGNITAGGSGKTPVVEYLLARALSDGMKPAVVTRGYKRQSKGLIVVSDGSGILIPVQESGDEAAQLARKFPSAIVIADEKRVRGAHHAVEEFGAELIVLDDAYQHRAIGRDVNIVVFDAAEGVSDQRLLPLGRLREPLANLERADVLLLSRCSDAASCKELAAMLREYTAAPILPTRFSVTQLREAGKEEASAPEAERGERVLAFCGIGSPASFSITLQDLGMDVAELHSFPDHHWYSPTDFEHLAQRAEALAVTALVTTEKDVVRISEMGWDVESMRLLYPELQLQFLGGEEDFAKMLNAVLRTGL